MERGETETEDGAERDAAAKTRETIGSLIARYGELEGTALLRPLIEREFAGRLAIVSSFGTESALILAHAAEIDPCVPVLFVDTGKLFPETLRYRDRLIERLGLRDVRTIAADARRLAAHDPLALLWLDDPDRCCATRKVEPLLAGLDGFDAWVSGRKRFHGGSRAALPVFEADGAGRVKINPLAAWPRERIAREFLLRDLPRHPLPAAGYASVGCITCTTKVLPEEEVRAGRWRDRRKTECGIHLASFGRADGAGPPAETP